MGSALCGIVPVVFKQGQSLVERPGTLDVSYMNLQSIINDVLEKTGLCIFYAPDGAKKGWPMVDGNYLISSDLIAWMPPNNQSIGFAAFPSASLDAHFTMLSRYTELAFKMSALKGIDFVDQSGIAKQWDFRNVEAILLNSKEILIDTIKQTLWYWGQYKGIDIDEVRYTIEDFNILDILSELEAIQKTIMIDLQSVANTMEKMKAVKARNPNLPQEKLDEIEKQIAEYEEKRQEQSTINPFSFTEDEL